MATTKKDASYPSRPSQPLDSAYCPNRCTSRSLLPSPIGKDVPVPKICVFRTRQRIYVGTLTAKVGMQTEQGVIVRISDKGTIWTEKDGKTVEHRRRNGERVSLMANEAKRLGYL